MSTEPHQPEPAPALATAPEAHRLPPPVYPRLPKSPGVALLLSLLFPGIGQVYNGQPAKAFFFFFGFVGSIYGVAEMDSPFPFAFLIPFVLLYNLVDAWRSAAAINARAMGGEPIEEENAVESPAWGAGLVLVGAALLANNLGWISLAALQRFWPVLLIVAGGFFLYTSLKGGPKKEGSTDGTGA